MPKRLKSCRVFNISIPLGVNCPDGWTPEGTSCYHLSTENISSLSKAATFCENLGRTLVEVNTLNPDCLLDDSCAESLFDKSNFEGKHRNREDICGRNFRGRSCYEHQCCRCWSLINTEEWLSCHITNGLVLVVMIKIMAWYVKTWQEELWRYATTNV